MSLLHPPRFEDPNCATDLFPRGGVSPVALVPPVAVVSVVAAALAMLGASAVLAMRWFSFVNEEA